MDMRVSARKVSLIRWGIIAGSTGAMALLALFTGLSVIERIMGCAFYAGMCLYGTMRLIRSGTHGQALREWQPAWYDGPYRGGRVRGVAFPVHAPSGKISTVGIVLMGVALLSMALYIVVTGRGVDGGPVARVVAVVILSFIGFVMAVLGAARSAFAGHADVATMVLAADAVHLPIPNAAGPTPWDALTGARERAWTGGSPDWQYRALNPQFALDLLGPRGPVASVDINEMPDPRPLVGALNAVIRDPRLRTALTRPDAPALFRTPAQGAGAPNRGGQAPPR